MIPDILSRLVNLSNNGYSGNFNGNGARKTVCLSDTKRARHGRNQMPVLWGILSRNPVGGGGVPHKYSKNSHLQ
jgi:hypothetical protein